jgi:hypothetical protein
MKGKQKEREYYNQQSELEERSRIEEKCNPGNEPEATIQQFGHLFRLGWFDHQTARKAPLRFLDPPTLVIDCYCT